MKSAMLLVFVWLASTTATVMEEGLVTTDSATQAPTLAPTRAIVEQELFVTEQVHVLHVSTMLIAHKLGHARLEPVSMMCVSTIATVLVAMCAIVALVSSVL